jgi:hypothetical protein
VSDELVVGHVSFDHLVGIDR